MTDKKIPIMLITIIILNKKQIAFLALSLSGHNLREPESVNLCLFCCCSYNYWFVVIDNNLVSWPLPRKDLFTKLTFKLEAK